jgi:hypothetical protein
VLILYSTYLRCPFIGEGSNYIASPEKKIQAPRSKQIPDKDEDADQWEVIQVAEYATNHQ